MTRCLMWMCVASLVFAGVASASVRQGETELDLLAGYTSQNGAQGMPDFSAWFVSAALGYFLNDNLEVQLAGIGALTETDLPKSFLGKATDVDVDVWGVGARAKWHFMPSNQLVPYLGAQILWVSANVDISPGTISGVEGTNDGTLWGPLAGVRYELNETNDVFLEYEYQRWEGDVHKVLHDGNLIVLGIVHAFKK